MISMKAYLWGKKLIMTIGMFGFFLLIEFVIMDLQRDNIQTNVHNNRKRNEPHTVRAASPVKVPMVFVAALCAGNKGGGRKKAKGRKPESERQIEQTIVMMKSAVALTSQYLRFVLLTDSEELFLNLNEAVKSTFLPEFKHKLEVEYKDVWYPPSEGKLRGLFKACSTERLFVPDILSSEYDSVIYLDTDIVFMAPPEQLWNEFTRFSPQQLMAMAPCHAHYGQKSKTPYYGSSGVNAGVILFNLTRLAGFPGGFHSSWMELYNIYEGSLPLADQDILNALFSQDHIKSLLHELDCRWNFRVMVCKNGSNRCRISNKEGVFLIHGNAHVFYTKKSHFEAVFKSWRDHNLGGSLKLLVEKMEFMMSGSRTSMCPEDLDWNTILLKNLKKIVETGHLVKT